MTAHGEAPPGPHGDGVFRAGDRVRLGDTGLVLRVGAAEPDDGFTLLTGFAKTARDGIGLKAVRTEESCDVVVTPGMRTVTE